MYFAELGPVEQALVLLEHGADVEVEDFQVCIMYVGMTGWPARPLPVNAVFTLFRP